MKYVIDTEQDNLQRCADQKTTNDVRVRLFEGIVIIRYQNMAKGVKNMLTSEGQSIEMPESNLVTHFGSQALPSELSQNGLYLPWNCNFPAIDFILKEGRTVWGVQVHVAEHKDELEPFQTMCEDANWQGQFDDIYLLYLSPEPSVTKLVQNYKGSDLIKVAFASKENLTCLEDLQWPAGCSIGR
jgi:hypothetical protein